MTNLVLPDFYKVAGRERWCVCPECLEEMPVGSAMTHWLREHRGVEQPTNRAAAERVARGEAPKENEMADATAEKGKVEDYVAGALRRAKVKVGDLTDEQRARAESPPEGLRGKALAAHVLEGGGDPAPEGGGEMTDDEARARLKYLTEKQTGQSSAEVREVEALRARLGEKAGGAKPRGSGGSRAAAYPVEIRSATARVKELKGKHGAPGPKQHVHVREVVTSQIGRPTKQAIVAASGVKSLQQLTKVAKGETDRASLKPLHELASKMGDDPFCKGRNLAAILVAWAEQVG